MRDRRTGLVGVFGVAALLCIAVTGCGTEECRVETVDVQFAPNPTAAGLYQADVATDRCGGEGSEGWRLEVECLGNCPGFTARVSLESIVVAQTDASPVGPAVIESHEAFTPDINEYRLYVQLAESVHPDGVTFVGRFTGSQPSVIP